MADYSKFGFDPESSFLGQFQKAQERNRLLAQQEQQNQLAALQLRAAQRGEEDVLAQREAYKSADPVQALFAAGYGQQAIQTAKAIQEQRAAQAKQLEEDLKLGRGIAERVYYAGQAAEAASPGSGKAAVLSALKQFHGRGIDLSQDINEISALPDNQVLGHVFNRSQQLKDLSEMTTIDTGTSILRAPRFQQPGMPFQGGMQQAAPAGASYMARVTPEELQQEAQSPFKQLMPMVQNRLSIKGRPEGVLESVGATQALTQVPSQMTTPLPVGAFQGSPQQVMADISRIPDPVERSAAMQAYQRQLGSQNVPYGAIRIPKEMTEAQKAAEAREQTRIGLEQRRVELAEKEAARKAEGMAEPLSKKEIQTREAKYPQATKAVQTFDASADEMLKDLEKLRDHPGLEGITGLIYGRTPGVKGASREAEAIYDKIMAKGGFTELQEMRNASPTGGALGNVSNQENQSLRASFAAIDRRQDAESVRRAINDAIIKVQGAKERVRDAYNMTYEYKGTAPAAPKSAAPAAGGPLSPAEQAELEQLRARFGKR